MNGHSGAAGRIWREKELSNETTVTTNVRLSHLAFVTHATCCKCKTVFSHFSFSICYCLPVLCEQLMLCILSFCINWQKRFARNPPRITFLNMFDKEPEQLRATVCWRDYDDFFLQIETWVTFIFWPTCLLSFYIQRPGTSIWMNSGCRYIVGCFPRWGKINRLKTMKMVLLQFFFFFCFQKTKRQMSAQENSNCK